MFKDHKLKRGSSWLLALVVLIVASACGSNPESGPVAPVPETGVGPATEIVDMDATKRFAMSRRIPVLMLPGTDHPVVPGSL